MKNRNLIFIFLFLFIFHTPLISQLKSTTPEKIYSLWEVKMSGEWYITQVTLWQKELDKNLKNAEAWFNYYRANKYANIFRTDKKADLEKIILDIQKNIPNTFEYYYLSYINQPLFGRDITLLEKAYQLSPERPETYYDLIIYYEVKGDKEKSKEFCKKLYQSKDIHPGWINYNYNVLMSTEDKAILFTSGDMDTVPVWLLQRVKGIREDVTVINLSLIQGNRPYLDRLLNKKSIKIDKNKFPEIKEEMPIPGVCKIDTVIPALCKILQENYPEIPVYFAATVPNNARGFLSKDDLYVTGLADQYSKKRLDNIALLKKNIEKHFRLDYLMHDWYNENLISTEIVKEMNVNYLYPFTLLHNHYKVSGENDRANYYKTLSLEVSKIYPRTLKNLEEYFSKK